MKIAQEAEGIQGGKWDLSDLYKGPEDPRLYEDLQESWQEAKEFQKIYQEREAGALALLNSFKPSRSMNPFWRQGLNPFSMPACYSPRIPGIPDTRL